MDWELCGRGFWGGGEGGDGIVGEWCGEIESWEGGGDRGDISGGDEVGGIVLGDGVTASWKDGDECNGNIEVTVEVSYLCCPERPTEIKLAWYLNVEYV